MNIPFDMGEAFRVNCQVKGKGIINGYPFRSSAIPHGDGTHDKVVNKSIRAAIGVTQGDIVQDLIEKDLVARSALVPEDFGKVLESNGHAKIIFEALSYSDQK